MPFEWSTDVPAGLPAGVAAPRLSQARIEPTREITAIDEFGAARRLHIPVERALTLYVDKQEMVTLMTLGAQPELLALGYLHNQHLIESAGEIESITVDWDVGAAAVATRAGISKLAERTARRVVTTGCGQGTVFAAWMESMGRQAAQRLPPPSQARIRQSTLVAVLASMRQQDSVHRRAGSVHGCALFMGQELLMFVEDVGRHNAIDTLAGWMLMHQQSGGDKLLYTTGRLTSEMVMKAAQMGVPVVISRNGVTALGHQLAQELGLALFGRAMNRHFLCYCGAERFEAEPEVNAS
jgi:FdhD protein